MTIDSDYQRIARAIRFLHDNPYASLADLGRHLRLSDSHCHRLFHRWAGITPKQFQLFLRKETALARLRESRSLLESSWDAGLSGPGRLHDLVLHWEAVTPGQFRQLGEGLTLRYGVHPSELGELLVALSPRGVCHLSFHDAGDVEPETVLTERWPSAQLQRDDRATGEQARALLPRGALAPLHVWGTPFQHKVWEALLRVPSGHLCSYGDLAAAIGQPGAARAVGTAVGQNPLAVIIPCHRVIRDTGVFGQYRWQPERKVALLARELIAPEATS